MVAHVLWEHEVVGSSPTAPTNPLAVRPPLDVPSPVALPLSAVIGAVD